MYLTFNACLFFGREVATSSVIAGGAVEGGRFRGPGKRVS